MTTPPNANLPHPYEMHTQGGGGVTIFEAGDAVALPLLHLNKGSLRGADGQRLSLEYAAATVVVEGEGLVDVYSHLLAGRVKVIRPGRHQTCTIRQVRVIDP